MIETKRDNHLNRTVGTIASILLALFAHGAATRRPDQATPKDSGTEFSSGQELKDIITKQVSDQMSGNFQYSLDMRENVDFLLTPGLLVQEAISNDAVITYPIE